MQGLTRGSLTIEAAIVMMTVFTVLFTSIWMVFVLFQNLNLTIVAQDVARVSAHSVNKPGFTGIDLETGDFISGTYPRMSFPGFYWRSIPVGRRGMENHAATFAADSMDSFRLLSPDGRSYQVQVRSVFPFTHVIVTATETYSWPLAGFLQGITPTVEARAQVNEPAEMIRYIDFVEDLLTNVISAILALGGD